MKTIEYALGDKEIKNEDIESKTSKEKSFSNRFSKISFRGSTTFEFRMRIYNNRVTSIFGLGMKVNVIDTHR